MSEWKKKSLVQIIIEQKNAALKKRGKTFKAKTMPRGRSFKVLERTYYKEIKEVLIPARNLVNSILIPKLDMIIRQRDALRPKSDSAKFDSWATEIESTMNNIKLKYQQIITLPKIKKIASNQSAKINNANSKDFDKGFEKVLGVPPIKLESWLQEEVNNFTKENVSLIKSIPETYFSQVESTVSRMVQQGKMTSDIADEIETRYGVSESKAALIARDQTNKFNGSLNQLRNQEVGITKFEWSTSQDDRVRESHASKEGKIYSWDNPPADTGIPGADINCRCVGLGVIGPLEE